MKILLASSSSGSRGGGEIFLRYLGEGLAATGCRPVLWASDHPRLDDLAGQFASIGEVIRAKYTNTYDRRRRSLDVFFSSRRVERIAREWTNLNPDLVHVNKQNLEDGLDLLRAANLTALPALATVHLTQSASFLGARAAWLRDTISGCELRRFRGDLVAIQEPRADDLRRATRRTARIHAVPNGVEDFGAMPAAFDRTSARTAIGCTEGNLLFLCVGRLTEQKNPHGFLDSVGRLVARYPQARFMWVGDGDWKRRWDEEVSARGLTAIVRQIGWQADVRPWLHCADIYLHVAKFESFLPLSVLEALSARLPVVIRDALAADIPFLEKTEPFILTESSAANVDLQSTVERQYWGQRGRRMFDENFSLTAMVRRYMDIYSALLAGHSR